jgi:hypothetical protein
MYGAYVGIAATGADRDLVPGLSIGQFAKDVEVICMSGGLVGHVQQDPAKCHESEVLMWKRYANLQ